MTYDHSRKAGNCGDVWKHSVLVALADVMSGNSELFRYVECHAGAPIHELTKSAAARRGVTTFTKDAPGDSRYAAMARKWLDRQQYPAGWVFVADRLARRFQQVQIELFDLSPHVTIQYEPPPDLQVPDNVEWNFREADGYAEAAQLKSADLVFLDPPYLPDAQKDWRSLRQACRTLMSRRIAFVAWYPYGPTDPAELRDSTTCESWEVAWEPRPGRNLKGCGMLVSPCLAALLPRITEDIRAVATCMNWPLSIRRPAVIR